MSYARYEHIKADAVEAAREDIHPRLRPRHPESEIENCRACGHRFKVEDLTDDLLCAACDKTVKELEESRIS